MKYFGVSLLALSLCAACSPKQEVVQEAPVNIEKPAPIYETVGFLELASNDLISKAAKIEKLGGDYMWSEGPVWIKDGGYLLFTDVPGNTIYKFKEGEGLSTWMTPSTFMDPKLPLSGTQGANGLYPFDAGHIIVADHGSRTLYKMNLATQEKTLLADRFEGKRFNSPNDAVLAKSGVIYFTDPPYGLDNGVYALYPDGAIALLDDKLTQCYGGCESG